MVEFDITMDWKDLYDYNLRHSYSSFAGIMGTIWGIVGIAYGIWSGFFLLVIVGIALIVYLPFTLFLRCRQTFALKPGMKEPLHYVLDGEGITVSQGEASTSMEWDKVQKAISTSRSLIIYTSKVNASIFPRHQLGDLTPLVIQTISANVDPSKIKIRY